MICVQEGTVEVIHRGSHRFIETNGWCWPGMRKSDDRETIYFHKDEMVAVAHGHLYRGLRRQFPRYYQNKDDFCFVLQDGSVS